MVVESPESYDPLQRILQIGPIFIRHPIIPVGSQDQAFGIDRDPFASCSGTTESITRVSRHGQNGKTRVSDAASHVGIQVSAWCTIGSGEEDHVQNVN